jgi:hypothetical protein
MSSSPGNGRSLLRADEMTVLSKKGGVEGGAEDLESIQNRAMQGSKLRNTAGDEGNHTVDKGQEGGGGYWHDGMRKGEKIVCCHIEGRERSKELTGQSVN